MREARSGSPWRLAALTTILAVVLTITPLLVTAQDGGGRPAAPVITEAGVRGPSIVLTDSGTDPAAVAAENGIATGFVYRNVVNGFSANLTDANIAALQREVDVQSISLDRIVSVSAVPNQLARIGADTSAVGGVGRGGDNSGVGIAIIDSGVGPHPDLNIAGGIDCTGNNNYNDSGDHGTHVAGIAAARDNADSTTGSAPGARVYAVRALTGANGTVSAVICGLDWVGANAGAIDVVNMSLGLAQGPGTACGQSTTFPLRQAVCNVRARGVQVVAAAGNFATNANNYSPASYPEVIAVSAYSDTNGRTGGGGPACSGSDDQFATYSNFSADVMAPGSCITSTGPGGGTLVKSGTSMAAPLVAGAIAIHGGLGGITRSQTDPNVGVTGSKSGEPALYVGSGSAPGGGSTATPTRAATATPTRASSTTRPRRVARVNEQEATATPTAPATVSSRPTRMPRTVGQAAVEPTATSAAVPPTATGEPTPVPTLVPTDVPTQSPTATAMIASTIIPTEVPTEIPTLEPTLVPTEVPTVVPVEIPAILPADVTDTFFTGAGWFAVDDNPSTTWYMDVPAPVIAQPVEVEPVDETGIPADGSSDGVPVEDVPVDVPVAPVAEPEDLVLEIDLGYVQTVGSVRWQWTETVYARDAEVQISLDGETWTTVAWPDTWSAIPGEWQEAGVGLDTRYVRFLFPNTGGLPVVGGLSEVEVLPLPAP